MQGFGDARLVRAVVSRPDVDIAAGDADGLYDRLERGGRRARVCIAADGFVYVQFTVGGTPELWSPKVWREDGEI